MSQPMRELGAQELVDPRGVAIMEMLRKKLAAGFGVTVIGPYVTVRFYDGKELIQVSMQVSSIIDSGEREAPDSDDDK